MLKIKNERCYYDSGQHAWQVTQTLKFGRLKADFYSVQHVARSIFSDLVLSFEMCEVNHS